MSIKAVRKAQKSSTCIPFAKTRRMATYRTPLASAIGGDALRRPGLLMALGPRQLHVRRAVQFDHRLEARGLVVLGIENLDEPVRIDGLFRHPRDVAHGALNARAVAAEPAIYAICISPARSPAAATMQNKASRQFM